MTQGESAILDQTLAVANSPLPLGLWAQIASVHLKRPVGLDEFRAWRDDYLERRAKLLDDAIAALEQAG